MTPLHGQGPPPIHWLREMGPIKSLLKKVEYTETTQGFSSAHGMIGFHHPTTKPPNTVGFGMHCNWDLKLWLFWLGSHCLILDISLDFFETKNTKEPLESLNTNASLRLYLLS